MATDSVRITNLDDSYHRVAYDLAMAIIQREGVSTNPREQYMTLYYQCRKVVYNGYTFEEATGAQKRPPMNIG